MHVKIYDADRRPKARNLKRRERDALRYAEMLSEISGAPHQVVQFTDENGEIAFQAIPIASQ